MRFTGSGFRLELRGICYLTVAALMHSHHTVDPFHRTAGPYRLPQKRLYLLIGSRPGSVAKFDFWAKSKKRVLGIQ